MVGNPVGRSPGCPADASLGREGTGDSDDVPIGRIRLAEKPSILGGDPCRPTSGLARENLGAGTCILRGEWQGTAGMTSAGGEWETFNGAEDGASLVP